MTQLEIVRKLFRENKGFINNRMLRDEGILYTGRNRVKEFEKELSGQRLKTIKGKTFLDNGWQIVEVEARQMELAV